MTAILQPVILPIYSLITPSYTNFVDIVGKAGKLVCYLRPLLQAWLLPDLNTIPNNWLERTLFSSVVMVLALCTGVPG